MNIFILDTSPVLAACYQHDRHVVKMVLESAQILSTVAHGLGLTFPGQYKATHARHPCVLWAKHCAPNFEWLAQHAWALANEYSHRYPGRQHKSLPVITRAVNAAHPLLNFRQSRTPFAQAMPEQYRNAADAVAAYRAYYRGEKINSTTRWTNRDVPEWLNAVEAA